MSFTITKSARKAFFIVGGAAVGLIATGVIIGEWMRLNPCPLCIFQRVLYMIIGGWAIIGGLLPKYRRLWGSLVGLAAAGGLVTAAYQSWMQLYPEIASQCGAGEQNLIEQLVDWLGAKWPFMFMAPGFCTSKEYILGLTMANWSVLCFCAFLFLGFWIGFGRHFERRRFFR